MPVNSGMLAGVLFHTLYSTPSGPGETVQLQLHFLLVDGVRELVSVGRAWWIFQPLGKLIREMHRWLIKVLLQSSRWNAAGW